MNTFSHIPDKRLEGKTVLRQAQLVMLRELCIFDEICKKYSLRYWLDAGTLLGAARHGGFIPWDDDIDVMMPHKDYLVFSAIAQKELPFDLFFQTRQTDPEHDISWAKIRDRFSYMDDKGGPYNYNQGIPIDIFPAYLQTERQFKLRNIFALLPPFNNKPFKLSKRNSLKRNIYFFIWALIQGLVRPLLYIPFVQKKLQAWGNQGQRGLCYDPQLPWFQFFPENIVFPLSTIQFENFTFYAPAKFESYLTIYYGNWKTPPPENKRSAHSVLSMHITDAGPRPHPTSLDWKNHHGETNDT